MKKLLNTLYVTSPDSYLSKEGECVLVRINDEDKVRIPIHNLESIVCFGYTGASPALMQLCMERHVGLSFLTPAGKFMGRVTGGVHGNVLLRRRQYRVADSENDSLLISRHIIAAKIANARNILERYRRDYHASHPPLALTENILLLRDCKNSALRASDSAELRGIEGAAAKIYFSQFDHLILHQKQHFSFIGRSRRPPKDPVNAMLSFVYTLLAHDVQSALESVGLDPYVGFFHTDRPGRASLALDIMEELRAYMADRLVLTLINRKQVQKKGFIDHGEGGIQMDDNTRKLLIQSWQKRKQEEIEHPFLGERIPVGLIPYVQSMLLARQLRGDLEGYPVFLN